jgi:hypothetical protein
MAPTRSFLLSCFQASFSPYHQVHLNEKSEHTVVGNLTKPFLLRQQNKLDRLSDKSFSLVPMLFLPTPHNHLRKR